MVVLLQHSTAHFIVMTLMTKRRLVGKEGKREWCGVVWCSGVVNGGKKDGWMERRARSISMIRKQPDGEGRKEAQYSHRLQCV